MMSRRLEAYVSRLERELRTRGIVNTRIVDEVREHLLDAVEAGLRRGLSVDAAEDEALARFGPPETVVAGFARARHRMLKRLVTVLWNMGGMRRRAPQHAVHYHDVAARPWYHFALCLKRPHRDRFRRMSAGEKRQFIAEKRARGEDVSAFEMDPRVRLVQFLEEFGRRTFGSSGTLESLTLLEDTTDATTSGGRYLAAFGTGSRMIWTVALRSDGAVSFDGTNAPA